MYNITINNKKYQVDVPASMPLLWVLRDQLQLTGTKYSCGIGQCGACTVLVDGSPVRSCSLTIEGANGKSFITIEGLAKEDKLHPVQEAWVDKDVAQCGYCQSGQILAAVALLNNKPNPTAQDIEEAYRGHLCRCGTYPRIKEAILSLAKPNG